KVVQMEEERFSRTIDQGIELLSDIVDKLEAQTAERRELSGDLAFKLYDTFGFPIDLTREILEEKQIALDEESFTRLMAEQRARARKARESLGDLGWEGDVLAGLDNKTTFVGYQSADAKGKLVAIVTDGAMVDALSEGTRAALVLDVTPFYAESGGQAGDMGIISDGKSVFQVYDCKKSPTGQFLHLGEMKHGVLLAGSQITAAIAKPRHSAIMRNHTAAHLLQ
ncbi:MAG: alanine--tRNA ligase-related protein, partial [Oscillospiraceae bacterium]